MRIDNPLTDPIEIKIALIRANVLQSKIARKMGVSKVIVTNVIKGRRTSMRVRKAIAKAIGKRVEELWPPEPRKIQGLQENHKKPLNHALNHHGTGQVGFGAAPDHAGSRARKAA